MKLPSLFLLAALPVLAQSPVRWETNLDAALARAKAENKQVFLDVWAEWCGPCQFLKKQVFPTPEAEAALAKYVPVAVMVQTKDGKDQPHGKAVAANFKVEGFPTLVILSAEGKEVRRKVGAFRTGADLAAWLGK